MTEMAVGDVKIDACQGGCGGLWFDRRELAKVEKAGQSAGAALLDIDKSATRKVDPDQRRNCPRDPSIVMTRHFSSVKRAILVDECPKCAGIFLDAGELAGIEAEYQSEAERHKATEAYYGEVFDPKLAKTLSEDRAKTERARRVAHLFRFICPSYYLAGKQEWGAF
jgi:Zn-finger nucleic acid-binding protein